MSTPRLELPSGLWAGHYVQLFLKHAQQMTLEFADGLVRGDGVDGLGAFAIEGEYRVDQGEVRLGWIKTYERAHSVLYLGKLEQGSIVGRWSLASFGSGSFALSPASSQESRSNQENTL
jgi:hypothetical protein